VVGDDDGHFEVDDFHDDLEEKHDACHLVKF